MQNDKVDRGAFNLPVGTVRAIISFGLVGVLMAVVLIGTFRPLSSEVLQAITGIAGMVVGHYFGQKK